MSGQAKKRYALVGTGGRSGFYYTAIAKDYSNTSQIVALCDTNQTRMNHANSKLESLGHGRVPTYLAADFDKMIADHKPDEVIITTGPDRTHNLYIVRAMELGIVCVCAHACLRGYSDHRCAALQGDPASSRPNRTERAGHLQLPLRPPQHQDLRDHPVGRHRHGDERALRVDAQHVARSRLLSTLAPRQAQQRRPAGAQEHAPLRPCQLLAADAAADGVRPGRPQILRQGERRAARGDQVLHASPREQGGRGRPVRAAHGGQRKPEGHVPGRGARGLVSLTAYAPWEGFRVSFNGTGGRLEAEVVENSYVNSGGDQSLEGSMERRSILLRPLFEKPSEIEIEESQGAHGGGDAVLLQDLFGEPVSDEYRRAASHIDGAASILTGIAANRSIATGQVVDVDDILTLPE